MIVNLLLKVKLMKICSVAAFSPWGLRERPVTIAPNIHVIMPARARYVAVDFDGSVWVFSHIPVFNEKSGRWCGNWSQPSYFQKHVRDVELEGEDPKTLLWCK